MPTDASSPAFGPAAHDLTVHALFARRARGAAGDREVLRQGDLALSGRQLARAAAEVASRLRRHLDGTGSGVVGVLLGRDEPAGVHAIVGMLGALEAGAAYLPLAPDLPAARRALMLREAAVRALVASEPVSARREPQTDDGLPIVDLPSIVADCVLTDGGLADGVRADDHLEPDPHNTTDADAPAYVLYTSGSTGRPKGVAIRHRTVVNLVRWHELARPGACRLRTAQVCSPSFDFSVHEIFSTLCGGGVLVVAPDAVRRDPFALARFLEHEHIERLFLPVTALRQLAEAVDDLRPRLTLREVLTTGERLRLTPALRRLFARTGARLHNHYGATEFQDATAFTLEGDPATWPEAVPIGRAIDGVTVHLLGDDGRPVTDGEVGNLSIGGVGVAIGYLARPELTRERFRPGPDGELVYATGDLARRRADGELELLGRADDQVKIDGVRVEPGEVESRLAEHPAVRDAAVVAHEIGGRARLIAYVTPRDPRSESLEALRENLRAHLAELLPAVMVPEAFVVLDALPTTASGKTDRRRLEPPTVLERPIARPPTAPRGDTERTLVAIWRELLGVDEVGVDDSFFELGGSSLQLVEAQRAIAARLGGDCSVVDLFRHPTIAALARHLRAPRVEPARSPRVDSARARRHRRSTADSSEVAIVGAAGRFPGADDLDAFWRDLCAGVESIERLEFVAPSADSSLRSRRDYVSAAARLRDIEHFDAAFFGLSPKQAALLDPQQRLALELAWEAFEDAGHDPAHAGRTGVFVGSSLSTYLLNHLAPHFGFGAGRPLVEVDTLQTQLKLGNDRNYLPTRISFALDLQGPSLAVQTACSSSLTAVHLACRALHAGDCDLALAGGVSVIVPQDAGYLYEPGMIRSPDGHCRAFDARAAGTLFGSGGGLVLLKPLEAARADGDHVVAVVKGSAVNNDGADKVAFTAPHVEQQTELIVDALADAGVDASSIGYVEAHGTGTELGDPIEVAALHDAFRQSAGTPLPPRSCGLGSVKTNIGHLDEAAGIAGLLKAALALEREEIPPSLHFERPNPQIDFDAGPFEVVTERRAWPRASTIRDDAMKPRRAGVSSFGMGGSNCHVVLEEAPPLEPSAVPAGPSRSEPPFLLPLSARTPAALQALGRRWLEGLEELGDGESPETLADHCATAAAGRRHFEQRLAVVGGSADGLRRALETRLERLGKPHDETNPAASPAPRIALLFGGQGSLPPAGLDVAALDALPDVGAALDAADEILRPAIGRPLRPLLSTPTTKDGATPDGTSPLDSIDTALAQPVTVALQLALLAGWRALGVRPAVVIGHSVGELAAAHAAGALSFDAALQLAVARGRAMADLPATGGMLSVDADAPTVETFLTDETAADALEIAAFNGPRSTVVSGPDAALERLCHRLDTAGVTATRLAVDRAYHSAAVEPALDDLRKAADEALRATRAAGVAPEPDAPRWISTVREAAPIEAEALDAEYWVEHARRPVRFAAAVAALGASGAWETFDLDLRIDACIELSGRPTLAQLVRGRTPERTLVAPSLRPRRERLQWLRTLAALYEAGVAVDWSALDPAGSFQRRRLPTYPWQRRRCWIDAPAAPRAPEEPGESAAVHPLLGPRLDVAGRDETRHAKRFGPRGLPWLRDHRVFDTVLLPGVAHLEIAAALAASLQGPGRIVLRDVLIHRALTYDSPDDTREAQVVATPMGQADGPEDFRLEVFTRALAQASGDAPGPWLRHVVAHLEPVDTQDGPGDPAPNPALLADLQARCVDSLPPDTIYEREGERSIDLGPAFRVTDTLRLEPGPDHPRRCLSRIVLPPTLAADAADYRFHPVLLEACLLALTVTYPERHGRRTYVPVGFERVEIPSSAGGETSAWCHARLRAPERHDHDEDDDPETLRGDIDLYDDDGRLLVRMAGVLLKRAARQAMLEPAGAGRADWRRWLYATTWREHDAKARGAEAPPVGTVLLVGALATSPTAPKRGLVEALAVALAARGVDCRLAEAPLDDSGDDSMRGAGLRGVSLLVDCRALHAASPRADPAARARRLTIELLASLRSALGAEPLPEVVVLTRGASSALETGASDPAAQALWGLCRSARLEHPELGCTTIDLDPATRDSGLSDRSGREIEALADLIVDQLADSGATPTADRGREPELALLAGRVLAPRLQRLDLAHPSAVDTDRAESGMRYRGTWLLTGGLGDLGLALAGRLAERGVERLVLAGRRPPDAATHDRLEALRARGVAVQAETLDVADQAAVTALVDSLGPTLRGIAHLAGVLDDGVLDRQSPERFTRVLAPKLDGAWALHRAALNRATPVSLDAFVLFSSVTALLGAGGQTGYGAANAGLDALAAHRRAAGLPALSVQWGSWAEVGMSARRGLDNLLQRRGEGVLPPSLALDALEALLAAGDAAPPVVALLPIDWPRWHAASSATPPLVADLLPSTARESGASRAASPPTGSLQAASPQTGFAARLAAAPVSARRGLLEGEVRGRLAYILGDDLHLAGDAGFFAAGMDSLTSIELRNELQARLERPLSQTLAFDYPTIDTLVEYLEHELFGAADEPVDPSDEESAGSATHDAVTHEATDDAEEQAARAAERLARTLGVSLDALAGAPGDD
ncbi:MAG: type I polyketide synthase [Acidobacteriota bacterium]